MSILDVFRVCFDKGCKISISDILRSERYRKLRSMTMSFLDKFKPDTDEDIALGAGTLLMGELLNNHSEAEAIKIARNSTPMFGCELKYRPLIQVLGESIVKVAKNCLPDDVISMSTEWKSANPDRQIEIARSLYFRFRSDNQGSGKDEDLTMQSVWEKASEEYFHWVNHRGGEYLPAMYGKWDPEKCIANCQGKTQMLVAFARLAGSRVILANPYTHAYRCIEQLQDKTFDMVMADLTERDLLDSCEIFNEGLMAFQLQRTFRKNLFHVGVAIELCDGRWVLIDPHGMDWGVFSEEFGMTEISRMLEKYCSAVPGISLIGHDHGKSEEITLKRLRVCQELIERSRRMEKEIHEKAENAFDLIELVAKSDDLDFLLKWNSDNIGVDFPGIPPELREDVAIQVVIGYDTNKIVHSTLDHEYARKIFKQWLTFYHCVALNVCKNQLTDRGELVHPVCGFSMPEYSIGISALNSTSIELGLRTPALERFFFNYSFDQITFFNAMDKNKNQEEVAEAAARVVAKLPFMHPRCLTKLKELDY